MKFIPVLLVLALLAACSSPSELAPENFRRGMIEYLQQRGHLCLAKYDWPLDVPRSEFDQGTRNALQMPVLEKLGLVTGEDTTAEQKNDDEVTAVPVRRYRLTEAGKPFFITRAFTSAAGERKVERGDICAATLTLDRIVAVESPGNAPHPDQVSVSYTYNIDAAPWTQAPEFRKVFPLIDRMVHGAHQTQLKQGFTRTDAGWVASDLLK